MIEKLIFRTKKLLITDNRYPADIGFMEFNLTSTSISLEFDFGKMTGLFGNLTAKTFSGSPSSDLASEMFKKSFVSLKFYQKYYIIRVKIFFLISNFSYPVCLIISFSTTSIPSGTGFRVKTSGSNVISGAKSSPIISM